jgi:hypothetical protein
MVGGMARKPQDLISKLADAGEEAFQKVTDIPGAARLTQSVNATRERLDELTKKMRGIDAMEKRIAKLERRLDDLQGKQKATSTRAVAKTTTSSSRKTGSSPKKRTSSTTRKKT